MKKIDLSDAMLCAAIEEMECGLIDADLGGNIVKKRIALPGRGKSGSIRTIVATKKGSHWFFLYGFPKNRRANISQGELEALQDLASDLLRLGVQEIVTLVAQGELTEVING